MDDHINVEKEIDYDSQVPLVRWSASNRHTVPNIVHESTTSQGEKRLRNQRGMETEYITLGFSEMSAHIDTVWNGS